MKFGQSSGFPLLYGFREKTGGRLEAFVRGGWGS